MHREKERLRSAGLEDRTLYLSEQADTRLDGYLRDKSMVEAMREFVRSDDLGREVAALSLPPSYPASAAYDLFQRAISEFRQAVG